MTEGGSRMIKTIFKEKVSFTTKMAMVLLALAPALIEGSRMVLNACSWWFGEPKLPNSYKK